jgi:hypothetical protein
MQNAYSTGVEKILVGVEFDRRIDKKLGLPYEILRSRPV